MSAGSNRLVSRVWQTDLENEQVGIFSDKDSLQIVLFEDDVEKAEVFLTKEQVRELHEELGKWLEAVR